MSSHPPLLSSRALNTPPSPIRKLVSYSRDAENHGKKVFYLNIGQPDVYSPRQYLEGIRRYTDPVLAYERSEGNFDLRKSWGQFAKRINGLDLAPEDILITTGASEALIFLFMVCCDPGSEVIIFDPTYANYNGFAAISGVNLVPLMTKIEENFSMPSAEAVRAKLTANTRAILLCNPNNPTGNVYTPEQIKEILEICDEENLFLIVDETYREFVFNGTKAFSVLEFSADNPRVAVVDSLSKRFSICGARIGAIFSKNAQLLQKVLALAQARLASPTIEQFAATFMLDSIDADYIETTRKIYEGRVRALVNGLSAIPGVYVSEPKGGFYCVAKLPVDNAEDFIKFMLTDFEDNNETVFMAPASGFYTGAGQGLNQVRVAAVLEENKLIRACELIGLALKKFQGR